MSIQAQNNFGPLAKTYDATRRGYPDELYEYLQGLAGSTRKTLDLGCGTGISTRELKAQGFDVVGADKDEEMLRVAREKTGATIQYAVAPANQLPFPDGEFDIVTAFTSFHWFTDDESVADIKRVLKSGGLFFAVLKKSIPVADFDREYRRIATEYLGEDKDSSMGYVPKEVLQRNDFKNIQERSFMVHEKFTVPEILAHFQSLSFWNLVPEDKKPAFLGDMEALYTRYSVGGFVIRTKEVSTVAGYR